MIEKVTAPTTADALRAEILARYETLSKRLQQIARYVLDEPSDIALETLAVIADRCGVQPSAIVRFAKSFGYDGASQMQRLFRDGLLLGNSPLGYSERVRQFGQAVDNQEVGGPGQILGEFIAGNVLALNNLGQAISEKDLSTAVRMIAGADTVYVIGTRRSFPVAAYLAYSLLQAGKRVVFIDGVGGLANRQVQAMTKHDLLLAVSFQPYAEETVHVVEAAATSGGKIMTISDSLVSPVAKPASLVFQVRESEVRKFRSLGASLCLAQALVVAYAFESSASAQPGKRRAKLRPGTS